MGDLPDSSSPPGLVPTTVSGTPASDQECEIGRYGLRFQTQRKLASGGMASIVHAFDPLLCRHVAMKVLHPSLVQQAGELDAFLREARVTAQLEHPNIVPVYDFARGERDDWACFAMKLVQGQSLGDMLAELGDARVSPERLPGFLELLLKVCDAVAYAHSRRIIHLDLKPHNIMVGGFGQVYVMDWGIAVRCTLGESGRLAPSDRHGSLRGTLSYMAPEQLENDLAKVDERADVYGLGSIIYELLTGHPPFTTTGTNDLERLRSHRVCDPSELVDSSLSLPSGLVQVAMRALARDPDERYASVLAMRAELEHLVRGGGWFPVRRFEPGAYIVREGEPANEAFLLIEGQCDVFRQSGASALHLRCRARRSASRPSSRAARVRRRFAPRRPSPSWWSPARRSHASSAASARSAASCGRWPSASRKWTTSASPCVLGSRSSRRASSCASDVRGSSADWRVWC